MKKNWLVVAGFLALVFTPAIYAGPGEQDWQSMTPEERSAARDARRAEWESLSDEEKQARREERRARFESLQEGESKSLSPLPMRFVPMVALASPSTSI